MARVFELRFRMITRRGQPTGISRFWALVNSSVKAIFSPFPSLSIFKHENGQCRLLLTRRTVEANDFITTHHLSPSRHFAYRQGISGVKKLQKAVPLFTTRLPLLHDHPRIKTWFVLPGNKPIVAMAIQQTCSLFSPTYSHLLALVLCWHFALVDAPSFWADSTRCRCLGSRLPSLWSGSSGELQVYPRTAGFWNCEFSWMGRQDELRQSFTLLVSLHLDVKFFWRPSRSG